MGEGTILYNQLRRDNPDLGGDRNSGDDHMNTSPVLPDKNTLSIEVAGQREKKEKLQSIKAYISELEGMNLPVYKLDEKTGEKDRIPRLAKLNKMVLEYNQGHRIPANGVLTSDGGTHIQIGGHNFLVQLITSGYLCGLVISPDGLMDDKDKQKVQDLYSVAKKYNI